jgi:hypothetical protein
MRKMHHSKILPLLLVIVTISLYSCKSGMRSKSVFGGKKSSGKNIFQRYQSRDFQAKKHDKPNVTSDEEEGDHKHAAADISTVSEQKNATELHHVEPAAITTTTEPHKTEVPTESAVGISSGTEIDIISSPVSDAAAITTESVTESDIHYNEPKTGLNLNYTIAQATSVTRSIHKPYHFLSKKVQIADFRTSLKALHLKAEKKGKSYLWILYFGIAQGFTALILGFKHIFQMLDSPIDAGNKSLGISYAATAILAIHAMLLIGLVKNFM